MDCSSAGQTAFAITARERATPTVGDGRAFTRVADLVITVVALFLVLPLMILIALAVVLSSPGPILFRHRRIGRGGRPFHCLKVRSMVRAAAARLDALLARAAGARAAWQRDHKLARDPRITRLGRFLRKSSLDELPQLVNVLRAEMSLVGPRPISEAEISRYGRYIADYFGTTPGITGLWQISGRNAVSYRRRVALDVAFSRSQSPGLYFRILILTIPAIILARGSS